MEELQKAVLSTAILYEDLKYLIFGELQDYHFDAAYKSIFKEMKKLYNQKQDIDPVIIVSNLGNAYTEIVISLSDTQFMRPNIKQYIKLLKENYSLNQAIQQTKQMLIMLEQKENRNKPEELQSKFLEISKLFNVDENNNQYKSFSMLETMSDVIDSLGDKETYYKTGFKKLDNTILISQGDFIVLGGRPSSGKTTLATNIMANMSKNNKVLFFTLETNKISIGNKFIAQNAKIHLSKILHKNLQDTDYVNLLNAANDLSKLNLEIVEAGGMTVNKIVTKSLQRQADIIFIDYMQLINSDLKSSYERVTRISNELHMFAQKEKITVISLSQLRRPDLNKRPIEPTMSDLRESGAIEQDADAILLLYDPATALPDEEQAGKKTEIDKQVRSLIIAKNKLGRTGKINLSFYGGTQSFYEV